MRVENRYFAFVHEGVSLNELEQVRLNMRAYNAVWFDYRTSLRIDVIPRAAHLGVQPAAQWAKQICQAFAASVWTPDALKLRQKFVRKIGASPMLSTAGIPTWSFHHDSVHVWSHDDSMVDGCDLCRTEIRHFDTDGMRNDWE